MRLFFSGLLIAWHSLLPGQVIVEGININEVEDIRICELLATGKLFSRKVVITIDYGQNIIFGAKGSRIMNEDGKMRTFNSVMHAINFMEANGWEYIDALAITIGKTHVYHYYFRKRPKEEPTKLTTDKQ